jgi:DNA primase
VTKDERRIIAIDDKKDHELSSSDFVNLDDDAYSLLNKDELNERAMVRTLLEFGIKEWRPGKTVADYILNDIINEDMTDNTQFLNIEDMIDNKKFLNIINTYRIWYEAKLQPTEKNFLYHEDQEMAILVMSILEFPYEVSNGWQEHFEMPVPTREETYKHEVFSTVNYLRLRKIKRLISINQKDLEQSHNLEEQLNLLQTHKLLKNMEISMTKQMGTVILK